MAGCLPAARNDEGSRAEQHGGACSDRATRQRRLFRHITRAERTSDIRRFHVAAAHRTRNEMHRQSLACGAGATRTLSPADVSAASKASGSARAAGHRRQVRRSCRAAVAAVWRSSSPAVPRRGRYGSWARLRSHPIGRRAQGPPRQARPLRALLCAIGQRSCFRRMGSAHRRRERGARTRGRERVPSAQPNPSLEWARPFRSRSRRSHLGGECVRPCAFPRARRRPRWLSRVDRLPPSASFRGSA